MSSNFFSALYGDELREDRQLLIWTLPGKQSRWFSSIGEASGFVDSIKNNPNDCYFGVGLSPKNFGARQRCAADKIVAIPGLWADIDIAGDGHAKKRLPPTQEEAVKVIEHFPKASIIVHSGHGLQCFWLFRELMDTSSDEDRAGAAELCSRWSASLRQAAAELGYEIDSVKDLSRVLRVPGTVNRKGAPVPVEIIVNDAAAVRYNPEDFEEYLVTETGALPVAITKTSTLSVAANAAPPFDKFEGLCDIEPKFKQSWERTRRDLKDTSASGYDMSLASFAARAGWEDQDITSLLIAARRKHGDDLKLREDYYQRTIGRVRQSIRVDFTDAVLDEIDETIKEPVEKRAAKIGFLSETFGLKIRRIVRHKHEVQPLFHIETEDKGILYIGEVRNLTDQSSFRHKLQELALVNPPRFKGGKWDRIVSEMMGVVETVEGSEESRLDGMATMWVDAYLSNREVAPASELDEAIAERQPFGKDGGVYVFGSDFRRFVWMQFRENLTDRMMGVIFRAMGATLERVNCAAADGRVSTRAVWRVR